MDQHDWPFGNVPGRRTGANQQTVATDCEWYALDPVTRGRTVGRFGINEKLIFRSERSSMLDRLSSDCPFDRVMVFIVELHNKHASRGREHEITCGH